MPSNTAYDAAKAIWKKYERYLGAQHMGNQDETACVQTMADIISHHCDGLPPHVIEALNSGDGTYQP